MTYHPLLFRYCHINLGKCWGDLLSYTLSDFKSALEFHPDIMNIHWASASEAFGVNRDVFRYVYSNGWDYSIGTQELRSLFRQIVSPVDLSNKSLEDYL